MEAPSPDANRRLSAEEWAALDEDEEGELVDGLLEPEEMPDPVHELTVSFLIGVLRAWLASSGFVLGSEVKLLLAPRTGRKPDLSVFLPGSRPPPRRGVIRHPPSIVVEVISPSPRDERRDRVEKMADYAVFGVAYYWLIDPALGTVEIFERNAAGQYVKVVGATAGLIDPVPGCPGLTLDVSALWAELERLGPEADA
jgi:Uma2 family endonuclease